MSSLLYLHGFLSSPQSIKAQQTLAYVQQHLPQCSLVVPQLSNTPAQLEAQLRQCAESLLAKETSPLKVIGSSMGGFLATWLLHQYGGRAVLINPAVHPYRLLADYLGEHVNPYTQQRFCLTEADLPILERFAVSPLAQPENLWALLQTGDEVLDYQEAVAHYQGARVQVIEGGDHSFIGYADYLPEIMRFLQLQQ